MNEEYKSMQDNQIWDLVPLPEGKKPISCKWIFKTKRDSEGNVERYKARLELKALLKGKTLILQRLSLLFHRKTLLGQLYSCCLLTLSYIRWMLRLPFVMVT